jgi:hypothetical protein
MGRMMYMIWWQGIVLELRTTIMEERTEDQYDDGELVP